MAVVVPAATSASAQPTCPTLPATSIGASAIFSGGVATIGSGAVARNMSGTACATLTQVGAATLAPLPNGDEGATVNFSVNAPQSEVTFAPSTLVLFGLISAPSTVTVDSALTGTAVSTVDIQAQTITSTQTASQSITSTVNLLGFKCSLGPFTPVLTTGTSGSLTGTPLTGADNLATGTATGTGKLVANAFTVPTMSANGFTCPAILAFGSDLLLGLPLKAGKSSLTMGVTLNVSGLLNVAL
jgi:hypothetical protein